MAYLSRKHGNRILTQRDIVKLHVMTDVYHVLHVGKPVIGGPLLRWEGGAVVKQCYNRLRHWGYRWEDDKTQPESYKILGKQGKKFLYEPIMEVDATDFSRSELVAMDEAWNAVMSGYEESDKFFHSPDTFMGRAWLKAQRDGCPIRWEDIIDAYADLTPSYTLREHVKVMVSF